jgi:hypothetical protein
MKNPKSARLSNKEHQAILKPINDSEIRAQPIRDAEKQARHVWDEIFTTAAKWEIGDALNAILTSNSTPESLVSDLLNQKTETIKSIKRISEIDDLLKKSTNSFAEQELRIKKGVKLEAERKNIINEIKAAREKLLEESIPARTLRHNARMEELTTAEGLSHRDASKKIHMEDSGKQRTPAAESIRKEYTSSKKRGGN